MYNVRCIHCKKFISLNDKNITREVYMSLWEIGEETYHKVCKQKYIEYLNKINKK